MQREAALARGGKLIDRALCLAIGKASGYREIPYSDSNPEEGHIRGAIRQANVVFERGRLRYSVFSYATLIKHPLLRQ
jgi:hypothetical protein